MKQTLHKTHLLKLLDKMCKYEMDPASIVEDTERTWFCPQTDRRADRQMDKVKPIYLLFNFVEVGGIVSNIGIIAVYGLNEGYTVPDTDIGFRMRKLLTRVAVKSVGILITIWSWYTMVLYNMIQHTTCHWWWWNVDCNLNSQKKPSYLRVKGKLWDVLVCWRKNLKNQNHFMIYHYQHFMEIKYIKSAYVSRHNVKYNCVNKTSWTLHQVSLDPVLWGIPSHTYSSHYWWSSSP